ERSAYFIDPVHLNDEGMDIVARYYAEEVLASDFPGKFERPRWAMDSAHGLDAVPADQIRVVEATYGMNCRSFKVPTHAVNSVRPGNATNAIARHCAGARGKCDMVIDVERLGDPANSCGKDFSVSWRCGTRPGLQQAYIDGESNGK